jgi:hypothetical protein
MHGLFAHFDLSRNQLDLDHYSSGLINALNMYADQHETYDLKTNQAHIANAYHQVSNMHDLIQNINSAIRPHDIDCVDLQGIDKKIKAFQEHKGEQALENIKNLQASLPDTIQDNYKIFFKNHTDQLARVIIAARKELFNKIEAYQLNSVVIMEKNIKRHRPA